MIRIVRYIALCVAALATIVAPAQAQIDPAARGLALQARNGAAANAATLARTATGLRAQTQPAPYVQFPGYELDPLSSLTGWTPSTTGGATIATTTLSDGRPGIGFTFPAGTAATAFITRNVSINYDQTTTLGLWVEIADPGVIAAIQVAFSNESGAFTNWNYLQFGGSGAAVFKNLYYITLPISKSVVGGGSFATSGTIGTLRFRVLGSYKNQPGIIKFRSLQVNRMGRPKVALAFDDGFASQYNDVFRYMSRYGMVGTLGVVSANVGTANYVTLAQLQSMYAAGWAIVNHTRNHQAFNSFSTNSIAQAQTPSAAGALTLNGSVGTTTFDAPRHLVIRANDQGLRLTIVGNGEDGSPLTETFYTWTAGATNPVPTANAFTRVTSITVDQAATGTITVGQSSSYAEILAQITGCRDYLIANGMPRGANDLVLPQGEFNGLAIRAFAAAGVRSVRVVGGQLQQPIAGDFRRYEMPGYGGGGPSLTAAVMNGFRNDAINSGGNTILYMHDIVRTASTSLEMTRAEFQAFIDAAAADAAAGRYDLVTQTDLPVE